MLSTRIHETEAGIVNIGLGACSSTEARITKLAGDMSETFVRLYYPFSNMPVPDYLGITFEASARYNILRLKSTFKDFKLNKGDIVVLGFEDGTTMEETFSSSKSEYASNDRRNFIFLSDPSLLHFCKSELKAVRLINKKGLQVDLTFFSGLHNRQYMTETDGRDLVKIIAEKIIYGKALLMQ